MTNIFLSYSREDQATARRFADALAREGFSVWWDQTLATGETYDEVTEQALRDAKAVVVLWSKSSVASRWVRAEATIADRNGTLLPIMIEPCTRPVMFELRQTADLADWRGNSSDPAWQSVVTHTRRMVDRQATSTTAIGAAPTVEPAFTAQTSVAPASTRSRVIALAVIAALAIAGIARHFLHESASENDKISAVSATPAGPTTLAVLQFENISGDPGQDYFSEGLTDEVYSSLIQVRGLQVSGPFKGAHEDLVAFASEFHVAKLLKGSVRLDGNKVRITVKLIDGETGAGSWSKTYNFDQKDVLTIQAQVAIGVANALSIKLDVGELRQSEGGTNDPEAWDFAMQAIHLLRLGTAADIERAADLARQAVAREPGFSLGWYRLWMALPQGQEKAEAFQQVQKLTPNAWWALAQQYAALAGKRRWAETESLTGSMLGENALSVVDMDRTGPWFIFLLDVGRVQQARVLIQKVANLEPEPVGISWALRETLDSAGMTKLAQQEYQRSLALVSSPNLRIEFWQLAQLLRPPRADAASIKLQFRRLATAENLGPRLAALLSELANDFEDPATARAKIRKGFSEPWTNNADNASRIAMLADAFGDRELALRALRRSVIDQRSDWVRLLWYPYSSGVRSDPEFKKIVQELGLVDYWRKTGNWGDFCESVDTDDFKCH